MEPTTNVHFYLKCHYIIGCEYNYVVLQYYPSISHFLHPYKQVVRFDKHTIIAVARWKMLPNYPDMTQIYQTEFYHYLFFFPHLGKNLKMKECSSSEICSVCKTIFFTKKRRSLSRLSADYLILVIYIISANFHSLCCHLSYINYFDYCSNLNCFLPKSFFLVLSSRGTKPLLLLTKTPYSWHILVLCTLIVLPVILIKLCNSLGLDFDILLY